jgi:ubiquinone biosynthesis protein COQ9
VNAVIDLTTPKGRIIEAALKLAEARSWSDVTLMDIAREAGVTLLDLKAAISTKDDIIAAFGKAVDDEVLRRSQPQAGATTDEEPARDRVFGVIMSRFDVLQPYRKALKAIMKDAGAGTAAMAVSRMLRSQHWMLAAAGVSTDGVGGAMRIAGLAAVYAQAFRTWLDDEDPGMAKTMAVLDQRLRNGERWLRSVDDMQANMARMRERMGDMSQFDPRNWGNRRRSRDARDRSGDAGDMPPAGSTML